MMRRLMLALVLCLLGAVPAPAWSSDADWHLGGSRDLTGAEKALRARYGVMLAGRDYAAIEDAARDLRQRYQSAKLTSDEFNDQMVVIATAADATMAADLARWAQAAPDSYTAHYVLGVLYLNLARAARGGKWASETSEEQFAGMRKYAESARAELRRSLVLFDKPYPSYRPLIAVAALLGLPAEANEYLAAASKIDADAVGVYLRYFLYNTPRWGGTYARLDALVDAARKGPMSREHVALLESAVLAARARDESDLNRNPVGAMDYYLAAYQKVPAKEHINYLYWAAAEAKRAARFDQAIDIYSQVLAQAGGEARALDQRGWLYDTEKKDVDRAMKDYLAAAELGDSWALDRVGRCYLAGRGVTKDLRLAKLYLSLAAAKGNEAAKEQLKLIEQPAP
jgi:TPR repeat protein